MSVILNKELLSELNQCRTNPRRYSAKLFSMLQYYKGLSLCRPNRPTIDTKEGSKNVESCIKWLKTVRPSPPLKWSNSLSDVARFHCQDLSENSLIGHTGSDEAGLEERIGRVCQTIGKIAENIDFGSDKAEEIVCNLLIDDGMYARGQRLNIMKKDHKYVGAAVEVHKEKGFVCVMVFAGCVVDEDEASDMTLNLEEVKDLKIGGESYQKSNSNSELFEESLRGQSLIVSSQGSSAFIHNFEEEISEVSAFKDTKKVLDSVEEELSFNVSKTEIEDDIKAMPKNKPPLVPRPKEKNEEFVVSNFERSELSKDAIFEIKEMFDIYDTSGSGFLDSHALKAMKDQLSEYSNSEVVQALCQIETEGGVNFENLLEKVSEKLGLSQSKKNSFTGGQTVGNKRFDPTLYMRPEFTREDILEIKAAFDMFDTDNTGTINPNDLKKTLKTQGYEQKHSTIFKMINSLDIENSEKINFGEFLDLLANEPLNFNSEEEVRKLFNIFDVEGTGFIELAALKRIAKELGDTLDEQEIIQLFRKSDRDGDGRVSFLDFYNTMNKQLF